MFTKVPWVGFRLRSRLKCSRRVWDVLIRTEEKLVHFVSTFYRFEFFPAKIDFSFLKGKNINVELMHDLHICSLLDCELRPLQLSVAMRHVDA
jgi:hypothetical protein